MQKTLLSPLPVSINIRQLIQLIMLFCTLAISGCMILPDELEDELLPSDPDHTDHYRKKAPSQDD